MNGFLNFRFFGTRPRHIVASTIFLFIAGFFTFAMFAGCEKDNAAREEQYLTPSCSDSCDDCDEGRCYPRTVLDAVKDPEDATNDKINMILYHYAQAVREAAKNPAYRQYMLSALTVNNEPQAASLLNLAQGSAPFADFLNSKLRQSISETNVYPMGVEPGIESLVTNATWDANAYLRGKMVYAPYAYDPVIYYMKKPNAASANKAATVVIAQDVNDCDDVAGWRGDTELLVGEAEATTSEDLILFVGPGNPIEISGQLVNGGSDEQTTVAQTGVQDRASANISISRCQVKDGYRYEGSGKTEVDGWAVGFNSPTNPTSINKYSGIFWQKIKKCEVKDSKIFTYSPPTLMFSIASEADWLSNYAFIGFYEYDWYVANSNRKEVDAPCATSNEVNVKLQMKYAHEWYYKDYCALGSTLLPNNGSTNAVSNEKCSFTITRTQ
ncbi:MAG: hypothetical protein KF734_17290 [Saprospiraceae bacterium]|nr:hypothetical protein [Saprospiraceae bacterium]